MNWLLKLLGGEALRAEIIKEIQEQHQKDIINLRNKVHEDVQKAVKKAMAAEAAKKETDLDKRLDGLKLIMKKSIEEEASKYSKFLAEDIEKRLQRLEKLQISVEDILDDEEISTDKNEIPVYAPFEVGRHQAIIEKQLSDVFLTLRSEGKMISTTGIAGEYNHFDFNNAIEEHTNGSCWTIESGIVDIESQLMIYTVRCPYYTGGPQWWAKEANQEYREYLRHRVTCRLQGYNVAYHNIDQRVNDPKRVWDNSQPDPWTTSQWANVPAYNPS